MMRWLAPLLLAQVLLVAAGARAQAPSYVLFEGGQVRPLALSPDGSKLFAVNTPDNRLEIFDVDGQGQLTRAGSVPVGMEPVAVAARTDTEVWVVNMLSDSVSIVDLSGGTARVVRTLMVGDEPQDIVFAGSGMPRPWAFISTAHRGQNSPNGGRINRTSANAADQSSPSVPSTPRADVWVFDAGNFGSELGGTPKTVIALFGDRPRGLAVSEDGTAVYAAVFRSGNQTTALLEGLLCNTSGANMNADVLQPACTLGSGEASPGGYPPPHQNHQSINRPEVGLIVKLNRDGASPGVWQDEIAGRNWTSLVRFSLPDRDVFEIDASVDPPVPVSAGGSNGTAACPDGSGCWSQVGTTLFNLAVRPNSGGQIYVTNSDAQNHVRFEGPGAAASGIKPGGEPLSVRGELAHMRITVLDGASVAPRHLNKHIDYSVVPAPASTKDDSLSTPLGMAFTPDGETLYVAAFGSRKIGIFDADALESDTFTPDADDHIELSGGGPSGLVYLNGKLYVLTRFDNSVAVMDAGSHAQLQKLSLYNPEPAHIVTGRRLLYDARQTSSNGEAACASCHIFGDMDDLAWDLGDPDGDQVANGNPFTGPPILPLLFHPMKGPMTTQSLRGLESMGPQHWRGDRQGDEVDAFTAFNVAFPGLLGRASELTAQQMADFTEFALAIRYPPNPVRKLDNSLRTGDEAAGSTRFAGAASDGGVNCEFCHTLDAANGHFGGNGNSTFEGEPQHFKVPHLRNMYQKVGMFGVAAPEPSGALGSGAFFGDTITPFGPKGPQIRGFGFAHDGAIDTAFRFTGAGVFNLTDTQQRQMEAFMLVFPSDLAPIVGQQVTMTAATSGDAAVNGRINLIEDRAAAAFTSKLLGGAATECDLVAHLLEGGAPRGYLYDPGADEYQPDDLGSPITPGALRGLASSAGQEVTWTCAPPGSGNRMALDRDEDLLRNGVETGTGVFVSAADTGSDPALKDTDGDGFDDGDEVLNWNSDPNDPNDPNAKEVPSVGALGLSVLAGALGLVGLRTGRRRGTAL